MQHLDIKHGHHPPSLFDSLISHFPFLSTDLQYMSCPIVSASKGELGLQVFHVNIKE